MSAVSSKGGLGLPRRLAAITALLAVLLVVGATELGLSLAQRSRLEDLRSESVDLANTLAAYLTRIAPTGEPSALRVGISGWSRRHLTETSAIVFLEVDNALHPAAASDSTVRREPDDLDAAALVRRATGVRFHKTPHPAWQVVVPLGGRRVFGVLDVRVSTGRLASWARLERKRAYAFAVGAALLLAVGVGLLTDRWVGLPLTSLTQAMAGAHQGAAGAPEAAEIGPPEFRELAGRYNELRNALARRERESESRAALLSLEERARAYDRLAQAEEIAGSFAHEIGTPLNTMNGHLQLLLEDLRHAHDAGGEERVALLLSQLERVAKIVRGGLTRGSWPAPRRIATDLHQLSARMLRFLEPSLDQAGVAAQVTAADSSATAATDPDLVEQILLNLLKNAIEALPCGGRITLSTGRTEASAFVEVADDGPGLPAETRSQIFHPFVTSKGAAGTGLGLAVGRRLARTLGGELEHVESERGTRWRLTLPPADPS